jgi:hypothetical protein
MSMETFEHAPGRISHNPRFTRAARFGSPGRLPLKEGTQMKINQQLNRAAADVENR